MYEVHVVTDPQTVGETRDLLAEVLEKASYPIRQIEVVERSPDSTELIATLVSSAVDPAELDTVAVELGEITPRFVRELVCQVRTNRASAYSYPRPHLWIYRHLDS